jgi:hypothetical protein
MITHRMLPSWFRRATDTVLALLCLATLMAGCALAPTTTQVGPETGTRATAGTVSSASIRLTLRFDGHVATAILDDTAVARQFAELLPLTLRLSDPMGQAKSGPLPASRSLDAAGADRTLRTTVGELVDWSPSATVAVIYTDLGHSVPEPGLVRLGVIDIGLTDIAAAGNDLTMRIDLESGS